MRAQLPTSFALLLTPLVLVSAYSRPALAQTVGPAAAPPDWSAVDGFVRTEMVKQRVPGLAMAIVRNGVLVRAQGYGSANLEHNVPVTTATVFQSGSVGKQFTATLVMQLIGEGKLSLDDRLAKFFPNGPAAWRGITIRQMLSHTSGISEKFYEKVDLHLEYADSTVARIIGEQPLDFTPGSKWSYSNPGYVMLGYVIEKVTGRFYGDLLEERIFGPLGMTTAMIINEPAIVPNRAAGYETADGAIVNQSWVSRKFNTTADGSLYLTVLDLAKWDAALYGDRVLPQASLAQMWTPIRLNDGTTHPYGFGWALGNVNGHRIIEHGGSWQGFKTYIARYVGDGLTVIVMMNLGDANPGTFAHGIAGVIDPALKAAPAAARP
ncbi:MAG: beta-lactamase family protein [Gemmatimonadetes bacterium]|nr:beta-lactamase family protein [Gemmatimonadota bacterium]